MTPDYFFVQFLYLFLKLHILTTSCQIWPYLLDSKFDLPKFHADQINGSKFMLELTYIQIY